MGSHPMDEILTAAMVLAVALCASAAPDFAALNAAREEVRALIADDFRALNGGSMSLVQLTPTGTVPLCLNSDEPNTWRRGFQPRQSSDWPATTLAHLTRLEAASPKPHGDCLPIAVGTSLLRRRSDATPYSSDLCQPGVTGGFRRSAPFF
jgi:hypothetical protein